MNGHHSDVSSDAGYNEDHDMDETNSMHSYSSGWERSSTTEYLDSDPETEEGDDYFCAKGEFYTPYKSSGKTVSIDYKCELVVLPNPYEKLHTKQKEEKHVLQDMEPVVEDTNATTITNPWKKIDPLENNGDDCWKFLDEIEKKKQPPRHQRAPVHNNRTDDKKRTHTQRHTIDNSNTNKLCKYKGECRMNKNNSCSMVHSLAEWRPRVCRFNIRCKRKTQCGYYHTDTPVVDYLRVMIKATDTIYAKNSALYEKYL